MAPSDRGQEIFSSQHGEDVPLSLSSDTSVHHAMECDLSQSISGVSLGKLGAKEVYPAGYRKDVFSLYPELVRAEYPKEETPQLATTSSINSLR